MDEAYVISNFNIQGRYAVDLEGQPFLVYDSREYDDENSVFFIFASPNGLARLRKYRHWTGDGTFAVVPKSFLQLFTICTIIEDSAVPCAYVLMANRMSDTYTRVFRALDDRLGELAVQVSHPLTFLVDFEEGFSDLNNLFF